MMQAEAKKLERSAPAASRQIPAEGHTEYIDKRIRIIIGKGDLETKSDKVDQTF